MVFLATSCRLTAPCLTVVVIPLRVDYGLHLLHSMVQWRRGSRATLRYTIFFVGRL